MGVTLNEVKAVIARLCDIIIDNEVYFCELDSVAGDGDFGMSVAKGFKEVKKQFDQIDDVDIESFIKGCSLIITEHCGGASGPIWGSGFRSAARSVAGKETLSIADIANMFAAAVAGIQKRGGAARGEKTLLDALIPAAEALREAAEKDMAVGEAFTYAAQEAQAGAEATKDMVASKGRASYVGDRSLNHPDAGAMAIGVIFKVFTEKE